MFRFLEKNLSTHINRYMYFFYSFNGHFDFHDEDCEKKDFCKLACFSVLTRKKRRLQLTYDGFQPTYDF